MEVGVVWWVEGWWWGDYYVGWDLKGKEEEEEVGEVWVEELGYYGVWWWGWMFVGESVERWVWVFLENVCE